jgi:uncharacterized coiled-coil protein SlyX
VFELKGDRPQWQAIYERLETMSIGDLITDAEIDALLPESTAVSHSSAFWKAVAVMEADRLRTFSRVRQIGYRMVQAVDHAGLARKHHKRAGRQLRSALRKASSSDRSLLSHEDRRRMDDLEMNLARQADFNVRMSKRLNREVRERKADVAQVSERVDQLSALLAKHGIDADDPATSRTDP